MNGRIYLYWKKGRQNIEGSKEGKHIERKEGKKIYWREEGRKIYIKAGRIENILKGRMEWKYIERKEGRKIYWKEGKKTYWKEGIKAYWKEARKKIYWKEGKKTYWKEGRKENILKGRKEGKHIDIKKERKIHWTSVTHRKEWVGRQKWKGRWEAENGNEERKGQREGGTGNGKEWGKRIEKVGGGRIAWPTRCKKLDIWSEPNVVNFIIFQSKLPYTEILNLKENRSWAKSRDTQKLFKLSFENSLKGIQAIQCENLILY